MDYRLPVFSKSNLEILARLLWWPCLRFLAHDDIPVEQQVPKWEQWNINISLTDVLVLMAAALMSDTYIIKCLMPTVCKARPPFFLTHSFYFILKESTDPLRWPHSEGVPPTLMFSRALCRWCQTTWDVHPPVWSSKEQIAEMAWYQ